jgi:hypothetical protein
MYEIHVVLITRKYRNNLTKKQPYQSLNDAVKMAFFIVNWNSCMFSCVNIKEVVLVYELKENVLKAKKKKKTEKSG